MKVSIIGATGYSGMELIRLLNNHANVDIVSLYSYSVENHGEQLHDILPHLKHVIDIPVSKVDYDSICQMSDLVFTACPSGVSKEIATEFVNRNHPVIDLSGDLRLSSPKDYQTYYGGELAEKSVREKFIYSLADTVTSEIGNYVSNPGCYATATLLALYPLVSHQLIEDLIIVDAKSGLSGAGKSLTPSSHFSTTNENMMLYKVNAHQHIPEINQQLKEWSSNDYKLQFNTSLIPVTRGIFVTSYVQLSKDISFDEVYSHYETAYQNKYFIRLQPKGLLPELKQVVGSNFCDIGLAYNDETGILTVVSVIDNLIKGAAGQAIQNMNLMAGFDEKQGLDFSPIYP